MYTVKTTNQFDKNLRLMKKRGYDIALLTLQNVLIYISTNNVGGFPLLYAISKTMLNKSKSRYSCIVPDVRQNAFRFSPLSVMLTMGLSIL